MGRKPKRATVADMRGPPVLRSGLVSSAGAVALEDLEPCEQIGEGQYGVVHTMRERRTGQSRVMKTVMRPPTWDETQLKMEAEILQNLDHPHILRIFAWYEDGASVNIVMEHCMGGELLKAVKEGRAKGEKVPELWVATGIRQCFEALVYIHNKGVVHKDLKGENLMLLQSTVGNGNMFHSLPHVIICDLGLAEICSRGIFGIGMRARHVAGTPGTMAPEVWKGSFGPKCDVWSMGCVMFELFVGKLPFRPVRNEEELWFEQYRKGPEWFLLETTGEAQDLLRQLLTVKESARPSASECLQHQWLKSTMRAQFTKDDAESICSAVRMWKDRNAMQRALCLKMAAGCTCLSKLAGLFSAFDQDSSGVLEMTEMIPMLESIGIDEDVARDTANALDVNGDGSCEYLEFAAACLASLEDQFDELLRQEFNSLDTGGRGFLAPEEMDPLLEQLEPLAAARGLKLDELDSNGDGEISFTEFCEHFGREGVKYEVHSTDALQSPKLGSRKQLPMKEHIRIVKDDQEVSMLKKSLEASMHRSQDSFRRTPPWVPALTSVSDQCAERVPLKASPKRCPPSGSSVVSTFAHPSVACDTEGQGRRHESPHVEEIYSSERCDAASSPNAARHSVSSTVAPVAEAASDIHGAAVVDRILMRLQLNQVVPEKPVAQADGSTFAPPLKPASPAIAKNASVASVRSQEPVERSESPQSPDVIVRSAVSASGGRSSASMDRNGQATQASCVGCEVVDSALRWLRVNREPIHANRRGSCPFVLSL